MGHPVPAGYKYENLVIEVGGVSDETVIYGYRSCATLTNESDCTANYRPVLSSERTSYMKKQELVRLKEI
jgi:hypothetical protein